MNIRILSIIKCLVLVILFDFQCYGETRIVSNVNRSEFNNVLSTLRALTVTNLLKPDPFYNDLLTNLDRHEKSLGNFYLGLLANQKNSRVKFLEYTKKSLWQDSAKLNNSTNESIFVIPEKILNVFESNGANIESNIKISRGTALFVMEAGVGPVKVSSGKNKNIGYLEGGPSQVEWVFYSKNSENRIYPTDSVMELAKVTKLNKKEFSKYYQDRRESAAKWKTVGSTLLLSSSLNQSLSIINNSYTYSGYASDAMIGLSLVSFLAASSASNVKIEKATQLENLPNFYGLFVTNFPAGSNSIQLMCFSPPFDCIYSRRINFNVTAGDVSVIFVGSNSPLDADSQTDRTVVYDADKHVYRSEFIEFSKNAEKYDGKIGMVFNQKRDESTIHEITDSSINKISSDEMVLKTTDDLITLSRRYFEIRKPENAVECLIHAGKKGSIDALNSLGEYYWKRGDIGDKNSAISYWEKAYKLGSYQAAYQLGLANIDDISDSRKLADGAKYLTFAASGGIVDSAIKLRMLKIYNDSKGVIKN